MDYISESLRQNLFWLRIMQEHALFIRLGLPCEDETLRTEAQQLETEFTALLKEAQRVQQSPSKSAVDGLNRESVSLTTAIIDFKSRVLKKIICCRITTGFNLPLLMDHIRREAINFRAALLRLQEGIVLDPVEMLLQQERFWLRIMADHSKFIAHLLDPSERRFVIAARDFSRRFDELRFQTVDFESMLVPQAFENDKLNDATPQERPGFLGRGLPPPYSIGALERFTGEAIAATTELEQFKRAARDLIDNCKVLSIIPPLLADHVLREAERAVEDLTLMGKALPPPCNNGQPHKNQGAEEPQPAVAAQENVPPARVTAMRQSAGPLVKILSQL